MNNCSMIKQSMYSRGIRRFLTMIALLCIIQTSPLQSQWIMMRSDADSLVQMGATMIYNMEFDAASALFGKVIDMYPKHPAGYFLDAMVEWW
ncbi:MAG: hypothetical protein ACKO0Y_02980, partial [Bacteroidota bacterium]